MGRSPLAKHSPLALNTPSTGFISYAVEFLYGDHHPLELVAKAIYLVTAPRLVCYPQRHDFSMSLRPAWAIASIMQAASRNFIANSELVKCSV